MATKNALVTRTAMGQLEARQSPEGQKVEYKDLLNSLIIAQKEHPEALGPGDVFAIAHGAIFAGSDSTASTMQSFFWYVLSNKKVWEKLVEEVLSADLSEMVQYNEAQNLPYFQACLKEAMRIAPAVGLNITRKVPAGGAEIDGVKLPAGAAVAVNGWVLHRHRGIFGQDSDVFRPERWLDGDKEKVKMMERCMFQVSQIPCTPPIVDASLTSVQFGGGSHVCIGRHLAILEMNKVIPEIIRRYEISLVNPGKKLDHHSSFFVVQWGLLTNMNLRGKV
jgi:cytochrome P450